MKYPFPNGVSAPVFNSKEENEEQFKKLLTIGVKLQSLYLFICKIMLKYAECFSKNNIRTKHAEIHFMAMFCQSFTYIS